MPIVAFRRRLATHAGTLVLLLLHPVPGRWTVAGQTPPAPRPTFTAGVRLVEVDAIVTDAEGRPVRDLRQDEFEVLEDGRPQKVATFSSIDLPIEPPPAAGSQAPLLTSDVQTNVRAAEGRVYVILLDDLHTTPLRTALIRTAARGFVEQQLASSDVAAVVHVGGGPAAGQDFTADRSLLLASIDRFVGRKAPSETLNKMEDYQRRVLSTGRTPTEIEDVDAPSRADAARVSLEALARLGRGLVALGGRRKALLWFGEGVDYDLLNGPAVAGLARSTFGDLARGNVAVYGVDARGLRGLGDEHVQMTNVPVDPSAGLGAATLATELLREQENLRLVSNETGGFATVNTTDLAGAFQRVVQDTSTYYVLGYHPANERDDGSFRRIEVRVGRPGLEVRARRGYVASSDRSARRGDARGGAHATAALQAALDNPLPHGGLPLAAQAVPFGGQDGRGSLLILIQYGANGFPPASRPPATGDALELSIAAVDAAGTVAGGDRSTIDLDVGAESRQRIEALGFRTVSRLELPRGRYQLRIGAMSTGTGKLGSLRCDVEVPDPSGTALGLSPLIVTSPITARIPTAGKDARLAAVLPGPPTTVRAFRADDVLTVYAEVHEDAASRTRPLEIVTSVLADEDRVVMTGREERAAAGELRAAPVTSRIPLETLAPGVYVLRVEATSGKDAGALRARRELPFAVLPVEGD